MFLSEVMKNYRLQVLHMCWFTSTGYNCVISKLQAFTFTISFIEICCCIKTVFYHKTGRCYNLNAQCDFSCICTFTSYDLHGVHMATSHTSHLTYCRCKQWYVTHQSTFPQEFRSYNCCSTEVWCAVTCSTLQRPIHRRLQL